ncbi:hypothetical protein VTI74DRAFT_5435 [Chaetomium olivicolor]
MPTYHTPPPTPPPPASSSFASRYTPLYRRSSSYSDSTYSPPPRFSRTISTSRTSSRSRSKSRSRSTSPTASLSSSLRREAKQDAKAEAKDKFPYLFLGSIAAASFLAHKYWPRGFPHGEKEDWELSEWARRAKMREMKEKAPKTGGSGWDGGRNNKRGGCDGGREGGRARGGGFYGVEETSGHGGGDGDDDGRGYGWDRDRDIASRGRSRSRCRDQESRRGRDWYDDMRHRRDTSRERTELIETTERYCPLAPNRYFLEQGGSTTGSSASSRYYLERSTCNRRARSSSTADPRKYDYQRHGPAEVVYVIQPARVRSRSGSLDPVRVRRVEEGYARHL